MFWQPCFQFSFLVFLLLTATYGFRFYWKIVGSGVSGDAIDHTTVLAASSSAALLGVLQRETEGRLSAAHTRRRFGLAMVRTAKEEKQGRPGGLACKFGVEPRLCVTLR